MKQSDSSHIVQPSVYVPYLVISVVVIITYGHTLSAPFYLDDYSSIVDNPAVTGQLSLLSLWNYSKLRIIGYLSFALNCTLHGLDLKWFHLTNIMIHTFAGFAVFWFVSALVKIPLFKEVSGHKKMTLFPLVVALCFVLHPLQTQAVTYIVQRLTSLTAFFYIMSLACFLYARLEKTTTKQLLFFTACIFFGLLAFFTKQNSFTLPFTILLMELLFFSKTYQKAIISLLLVAIVMLAVWGVVTSLLSLEHFSFASLSDMTKETVLLSRKEYFYTQTRVLWIYIGLFFWPGKLLFDRDITIAHNVFSNGVLLSLFLHSLVIAIAIKFIKRQPIVSFGLFFFYLGHAVESGFIPIRDVFFEHRTYLPNLGFCIVAGCVFTQWLPEKIGAKQAYAITLMVLLIMAVVTWTRNEVWSNSTELWRGAAIMAPQKARPWSELGKSLLLQGDSTKALDVFIQTMDKSYSFNGTESNVPKLDESTAVNLVIALAKSGEYDSALFVVNYFLTQKMSSLNRSRMLNNKGNILFQMKRTRDAELSYKEAVTVYPDNYKAKNNLGRLWVSEKKYERAKVILQTIPSSSPSFARKNEILSDIPEPKKM